LPLTFNGPSVSVTVNGTTVTPAIYYTSPTQLGLVLPSSTPLGTGTITVTNNGQPSAAAPFMVVQSAMGLDVATDANYNYFSTTTSASPGQTIILWGSGVGADPNNDDRTYPLNQDNLTNIPMTVYIGESRPTSPTVEDPSFPAWTKSWLRSRPVLVWAAVSRSSPSPMPAC
jgi:uncharacterized protein (TIGR03437 family)